VLHEDLQISYYDVDDINTLTLKIKEDIEFQIEINVKLNTEFFLVCKLS
jgi:hypothetical protein